MENKNTNEKTEEKKKFTFKFFLTTVLLAMITSLATGGAVYYVMNEQAKSDKDTQDAQIVSLQAQITELQAKTTLKTYTDEERGFSLQYPSDYLLHADNSVVFDDDRIDLFVTAYDINKVPDADGACGSLNVDLFKAQALAFANAKVGDNFDKSFSQTTNGMTLTKFFNNSNSVKIVSGFSLCNGIVSPTDPVGFKFHAMTFRDNLKIDISIRLTDAQSDNVQQKDEESKVKLINDGSYPGEAQNVYNDFQSILDSLKFI